MQCTKMINSDNVSELFSANHVSGLPNLIKWHLAVSHMRPAALIARTVMNSIAAWPWQDLNAQEWRCEITEHSWMLIAMLLRASEFGSDQQFLRLFEDLESDYQAAVKRSQWLINNASNTENHLFAMAETIDKRLSTLEENFIDWAVDNQSTLYDELNKLANSNVPANEDALVDLDRFKPDWLARSNKPQQGLTANHSTVNLATLKAVPIKRAI